MLKYTTERILQSVLVLVGVTLITFILLNVVPGDPVLIMLDKRADQLTIDRVRHELGLDRPLPVQYIDFIKNAVQGDLGTSYFKNRPVTELLTNAFKSTAKLGLLTLSFSLPLSITMGILAAVFRGKIIDRIIMFLAMLFMSIPGIWLAMVLQLFMGVRLRILPISGNATLQHYILPVIVLAIGYAGGASRLIRNNIIDSLGQDYVTTARSKGVPEFFVVIQHVLKNAAIPVVTLIGIQLRSALGGAMIIETIFSQHGLGKLAIDAINSRDLPLIQGNVVYTAVVFVVINLIVDLVYGLLDPRVRLVEGDS
ncbi:MAG: ABC transporter permease [Limnochordia bacterium]|nr:ABC transporter permease [Limnochordia bacterium]